MSRASLLGALFGLLFAASAHAQTTWHGSPCPPQDLAGIRSAPAPEFSGRLSLSDLPPRPAAPGADFARSLEFGTVPFGGLETRFLEFSNDSDRPITIANAVLYGGGASNYAVSFRGGATPITLGPGETTALQVVFQPQGMGASPARLTVVHSGVPRGHMGPTVALFGVGLGEPGAELLVNCGGAPRMDAKGQIWTGDVGALDGRVRRPDAPPTGTADDELFASLRVGSEVAYELDLPNGEYDLTVHFATGGPAGPGAVEISVEGEVALSRSERGGTGTEGSTAVIPVTIADGALSLTAVSQTPGSWIGLAGMELRSSPRAPITPNLAELEADPGSLDFGFVTPGSDLGLPLVLENVSEKPLQITSVGFLVDSTGLGTQFSLDLGGVQVPGLPDNGLSPASFLLRPGQKSTATVTFDPDMLLVHDIQLQFRGNFETLNVPIRATGGVDTQPFLHVVIEDPGTVVDYDQDNVEMVTLDGTFSHTHYPGAMLSDLTWTEGSTVLGTGAIINVPLSKGAHQICLTIGDDTVPQATLTDCTTVQVVSPADVPGVLALYYEPKTATIVQMLNIVNLGPPSFAETRPSMEIADEGGVGGSPYNGNILVALEAGFIVDSTGPYAFGTVGGTDHRLRVDSTPITSQGQVVQLSAGRHVIRARFAVTDVNDLPADVLMAPQGSPLVPIAAEDLNHDQTALAPVINTLPADGGVAGGDPITITGLGFFPPDQVTVSWGGTLLDEGDFTSITPYSISFASPPGSAGTIQVRVQTPQGLSNQVSFLYKALFIPVDFTTVFTSANVSQPTSGDWGPDGRFYVMSRTGELNAVTFDQDYNVLSVDTYAGVSGLSNNESLGLCFNPYDPPSPVKVYVGHAKLFAQGGGSFTGPSPYTGQVSVLTGPNFDTPSPLITQLPTSNHDHAINGMQFDHNGDLLIAVGGNTNAGVQAPLIGDVPESPLSGAILKAKTSLPGFSGAISYVETISGMPNDDQVYGEQVDVAPGSDVIVQANGLRNAYDIVYTLDGRLYSTSNGPNGGYGPASTGPTSEIGDPTEPDRLDFIEYGNYYGHASRCRGRTDPRQNIFRSVVLPSIPGEYSAPLEVLSSSTDGICEYRATTFGGKMRGELLAQRWFGQVRRFRLAADGRSVSISDDLSNLVSLDVQVGPGGVILGVDYSGNRIKVMLPNDAGATGLTAYDIFPNRAPSTGGQPFVIGGSGFGNPGNTSVLIDGLPATIVDVTSKRIRGILPAQPSPSTNLADVQVTVGAQVSTIVEGFRYLFPTPGQEPGRWEGLTPLPVALGEVAAGVIDGVIYVVGEGSQSTLAYDITTKTWDASLPIRPFAGNHHSAEVIDGKLYLFGGLGSSAQGKVQIFDPVLESWSLGAPMPWDGGSLSTALIDGKVYAAGGIGFTAGGTVTDCAVYDPVLDSWTSLTPMPLGRNHAAAATDGERLWIFGGRTGGNTVANGFDDVQVYDPLTDTWTWDKDGVSGLAPMPQARGGTGRAVYYQGEFYVMGGETQNGGGAVSGNVYDRVDVYDPAANSWRLDASMPTARHGIYPVLYQSRMFLPGGGVHSANSQSTVMDAFTRQ